ncbi:hypothetical protein NHL50_08315 [Acidimicrobiia bacterium EGI L10123]|uniref:hypothetical protein n=1 Tax=Salinilacustrithrix flava TaxID=2957203 RepID=UPI003D7C3346|nr:hypothetical protein [Acidimicrobiia bacterium EGI L10123]
MSEDATEGAGTRIEPEMGVEVGDEEVQPRGTMVLLILFLLTIAAMWVWTYYTLLERS